MLSCLERVGILPAKALSFLNVDGERFLKIATGRALSRCTLASRLSRVALS